MEISEYLEYIQRNKIPPLPPDAVFRNMLESFDDTFMEQMEARSLCISYGLWVVIADTWLKPLAEWIGNRKCLEIMAGGGWIAKGLEFRGVKIHATDNFSWKHRHSMMKPLVQVVNEDAIYSVQHSLDAEVLLVSWPPYDGAQRLTIVDACEIWNNRGPIVYLGEGYDGCNAPNEFFDKFVLDDTSPDIYLPQWWGLHDTLTIGYWNADE